MDVSTICVVGVIVLCFVLGVFTSTVDVEERLPHRLQ
jgi:hypothetical protein